MNKKGVIWEDLSDLLLGGAILFVTVLSYFLITGGHQEKVSNYLQEKISYVNQEEILVSYMDAKIDGGNSTADILANYYFGKVDKFTDTFDVFLEKIYKSKVCWILYVDEKEFAKKNTCKEKTDILDTTTLSPLPDNTKMKVRLNIKGFAK